MLMDTYHQLWLLLRAYIDSAKQQSGEELQQGHARSDGVT